MIFEGRRHAPAENPPSETKPASSPPTDATSHALPRSQAPLTMMGHDAAGVLLGPINAGGMIYKAYLSYYESFLKRLERAGKGRKGPERDGKGWKEAKLTR